MFGSLLLCLFCCVSFVFRGTTGISFECYRFCSRRLAHVCWCGSCVAVRGHMAMCACICGIAACAHLSLWHVAAWCVVLGCLAFAMLCKARQPRHTNQGGVCGEMTNVECGAGISHLEVAGYLAADATLAALPLPKHAESPTTYRPLFNTAKAQVLQRPAPAPCSCGVLRCTIAVARYCCCCACVLHARLELYLLHQSCYPCACILWVRGAVRGSRLTCGVALQRDLGLRVRQISESVVESALALLATGLVSTSTDSPSNTPPDAASN